MEVKDFGIILEVNGIISDLFIPKN